MSARALPADVYEAVVFDFDGVLAEPTPGAVLDEAAREALLAVGVEPTARARSHARSSDLGRVRRLCAAHGLDPDGFVATRDEATTAAQARALADGRKPTYDDLDALPALADRGATLGVVSNNQQGLIDRFVERTDLGVDLAVASGREPSLAGLRRKKPRPHYLRLALAEMGVAPDRALYVGDQTKDVLAARALGADAAFVRRPHREGYRVGAAPDHEVRTLHDLP
jgi:HAD superfamily hydrolase (TIGR01549 family)